MTEGSTELSSFITEMILFILFLVGYCGLAKGIIKEYVYISAGTNSTFATWYCRANYKDLATFSNTEELQRLVKIFGSSNCARIGLYRKMSTANWEWSDGEPISSLPFTVASSTNDISSNCVYLQYEKLINGACISVIPYYCYRHLILVKEKKTWKEALQYCTTKYTGLASLPSRTQVLQAKIEMAGTQTVSVWTGLRFMNGKWFLLSRESPENQNLLPSCPARPYHCGALNNNTYNWENRDCNEKLNFLCYLK